MSSLIVFVIFVAYLVSILARIPRTHPPIPLSLPLAWAVACRSAVLNRQLGAVHIWRPPVLPSPLPAFARSRGPSSLSPARHPHSPFRRSLPDLSICPIYRQHRNVNWSRVPRFRLPRASVGRRFSPAPSSSNVHLSYSQSFALLKAQAALRFFPVRLSCIVSPFPSSSRSSI